MKRNVASQTIGVQMITAADGSAFTGSVSVAVTKDNGTQTAGAGTGPTHKGSGYHGYAPTQGETDADHIAFTFTGTGAIPATVQVYTTFPQTGDSFARLGAPAGASVSADVAAVKAETASIQADTNDIQTRLPAALVSGRIDASVGAVAANAITAAAIATDAIDGDAIAASAVTEIQSGLATSAALATVQADTDDIQTRLPAALVGGRIDASVGAMAAGTVTAAAVATGAIDADALAADAVAEIWDEQVDGTVTARQSLRLANSANGGKVAGAATTTVTIRDLADTKNRVSATVDADGNRTAVTRDLT